MPKRIVSAGLINLDIIPVFIGPKANSASEVFIPGKLIETGRADISAGGSVANSGLAFQFFGADVTLMGKVGKDPFGELVRQSVAEKADTRYIFASGECSTTYSIILAPPGVDRMFLHYPGADADYGFADIDFAAVAGADLFHIGYPNIMRSLYKDDARELLDILAMVKKLGVLTSVDMAAIDPGSDAAGVDWPRILQRLMPLTDFFVPSAEELCFMMDRDRHSEWVQRAGGGDVTRVLDIERDVKPLAERLLQWGARVVLIKCGAPGLYLRTADAEALSCLTGDFSGWAGLDLFEASYQEDRYLSGMGAGDVSLAAFLLAALEGYGPRRSLQLAAAAGACCVSAHDALSGLMSFEQMLALIDVGWQKWRPAK